MKLKDILSPSEAVLVGRFQPFTAGHLKAYKALAGRHKKVSVALVVRKSETLDEKNPFTVKQRIDFIKKAIPGVTVYQVPNLYYSKIFDAIGHEVIIGVGKDREEGIKKMGGSLDGSGSFTYSIIPRTDADISATKVRASIADDDFKTFKKLMPSKLYSEFERMKTIINQ